MWTKHSFFNYNRLNPFLSVCKWHGFTNCGVYGIQFRHLTQKQLRMQPQKLPFYLPPPPYPPTGAPNQCQCQLPCSCQSWLRPHMQLIGVRFSQMCCACVYVRVREWVCVLANCWLTLSAERLTFCDHCQKQKKTKKKKEQNGAGEIWGNCAAQWKVTYQLLKTHRKTRNFAPLGSLKMHIKCCRVKRVVSWCPHHLRPWKSRNKPSEALCAYDVQIFQSCFPRDNSEVEYRSKSSEVELGVKKRANALYFMFEEGD